MTLTGPQVIVLATPVFLLLIALEWYVGRRRGRNTYRLNDTLNSIGLGVLSQVAGVLTAAITLGLYALVHERLAPSPLPAGEPAVWIAGLVLYDLLYYWHHRMGHTVALFWAAHVVHHQSEDYNLGTALRQTSSTWVGGWVFYLPMALLGFPPLVFATVALIDLLYQYWVHTQQIGRLGAFDRWFCAPSNHRVHHAVNDRYLDRNYGGILMVWDRLFGTFEPEDPAEPCVYGTRGPLRSWNPLWANLQVYADLARDSWHTRRWADKVRVWFKPPGWRPADVAARFPKLPFDIARTERYDPPMTRVQAAWALLLFAAVMAGTTGLLWFSHALSMPVLLGGAALVGCGLWVVGRVCERRPAAQGAALHAPAA